MPLENCQLCRGTGWKLVPRTDGALEEWPSPATAAWKSVPTRVIERARIPKRYEHCDFESYDTDLADGKTWTRQHTRIAEAGKDHDCRHLYARLSRRVRQGLPA